MLLIMKWFFGRYHVAPLIVKTVLSLHKGKNTPPPKKNTHGEHTYSFYIVLLASV